MRCVFTTSLIMTTFKYGMQLKGKKAFKSNGCNYGDRSVGGCLNLSKNNETKSCHITQTESN